MAASSPIEINASSENETPRSYRRWIILAGILAVAAVASGVYYNYARFRESTDDAQLDGHIHSVSARVGGTVLSLKVKDNQFVKAGDVLLEIDPKDYQVVVDGAKADLAEAQATNSAGITQVPVTQTTTDSQISSADASVQEARATLLSSEKQVGASQARLKSAQALVEQARANAERDARDLERYRALLAKDEISQQQFDTTKAANAATRAQVESTIAQVLEAEQAIHVAQAAVQEQKAKLAKAEADARATSTGTRQVAIARARAQSNAARVLQMQSSLDKADLNMGYTVVRAPVSGVISQRTVEVGHVIQPGQPLLSVVPLNDVWVTANFKENQLAHMRPGQHVEIEVDAYKGKKFAGKVESIAAATGSRFSLLPPENATGNYVKVVQRVPVKIVFDEGQDPEHLLRPGLSVVPTVLTK